ncbi:MAG: hypothetical protein R3A10_02435 [Caldilineaceae bacterium]
MHEDIRTGNETGAQGDFADLLFGALVDERVAAVEEDGANVVLVGGCFTYV